MSSARARLHAGREKEALAALPPAYPTAETSKLVVAPSLRRITEVLPSMQGVLLNRQWIDKVQANAEKGPCLKVGMLYFEYLLRIQMDYEEMQRRYNSIRMQEFITSLVEKSGIQMELLAEQASHLMAEWPKYNMHEVTKYQLPQHSCQIQVLEVPPQLKISEANKNNSLMLRRLTTASLQQIQVPLELLLGQRPKWACLEDVRTEVKDLQLRFDELRRKFADSMARVELPVEPSIEGYVAYMQQIIPAMVEYKRVLANEVDLVVQYLLSAPETPVCLYGIIPDEDSLPHFFPSLFPSCKSLETQKSMFTFVISSKLGVWSM